MDPEREERIAAAAARGAASLRAGAHLSEVLRAFREHEQLGPIESAIALQAIEPISLDAAKVLVTDACDGQSFAHLGLEELRHLARIPRRSKIPRWLPTHLRDAIISGCPYRLFVRDRPGVVYYFTAETSDPQHRGSISGSGVSFDRMRDEARTALAEPGWCDELTIVREEPDVFLVHFVRVRERR